MTVGELCDQFLLSKENLVDSGEIVQRTINDYKIITDRIVAFFGKNRRVNDLRPSDFSSLRADLAKTWGPVRLTVEIVRVKAVFRWGADEDVIEHRPKWGKSFRGPAKRVLPANGMNVAKSSSTRSRFARSWMPRLCS